MGIVYPHTGLIKLELTSSVLEIPSASASNLQIVHRDLACCQIEPYILDPEAKIAEVIPVSFQMLQLPCAVLQYWHQLSLVASCLECHLRPFDVPVHAFASVAGNRTFGISFTFFHAS